jgi:hypothetical protein
VVLAAAVLAGLALVQVTVLAWLPAPLAAADLVVVAVLALAHARGPLAGAAAGAWSGALLDLLPPAAGPLGGWVLILGLAGLSFGHVVRSGRPGPFTSMLMLALAAGLVALMRAAVLWFAGVPASPGSLSVALTGAAGALVLAPLALLLAPGRRRTVRIPGDAPAVPVP